MLAKVKGHPDKILEPSAGSGNIVEAMLDYSHGYGRADISVIENDPDLQAVLRGKRFKLIDSDFLAFSGQDKFDLIIANAPFDEGEKHLSKAIDIMYRGQIVFLLNAETIRNPHTYFKRELVKKLTELNADIEYISDAFVDAERPTKVEVALIYINIERKVEDDLFADCTDQAHYSKPDLQENYEVTTKNTIEDLVAEYDQIIRIGTETIIGYYRNYKKIGGYIALDREVDKYSSRSGDMTGQMQEKLNVLLKRVREDFWRRILDLEEVRKRMTIKRRNEFEEQLKLHCRMNFTAANIRQFVLNFISTYEESLIAAVMA